MKKSIALIGSTGSIGLNTIEVAKRLGIRVAALAANKSSDILIEQARSLRPETVCIYDKSKYQAVRDGLFGLGIKVVSGMEGLCEAACTPSSEITFNSVVGMVGLRPTVEAISTGKDIALANKETLVAGGSVVNALAKKKGVRIYPVDSEHSAIFQSLQSGRRSDLERIILTASGGPFYGKSRRELSGITVEDALKHPTWSMGAKITVDSATMMNKGLELIEAIWLFGVRSEDVEIVIHRESVLHSAVMFKDGSVIAQLGDPDMKIPIQYALTCPERPESGVRRLSLTDYGSLTFKKPDYDSFDCLRACQRASNMIGSTAPAIVNGANEAAVAAFLSGRIGFLRIGELVTEALDSLKPETADSLEIIEAADCMARELVLSRL